MVSPTASICETYRHSEQKQSQKFCGSKEGKNSETHPKSSEKGETGCVLGAGEGSSGWRRMKPGEKTRKARRKSRDGLVSPAGSVGPGRSPPGCRPPRHAPQAGLRAHLAAKSYRTLTKKSGTAKAIPDFLAGAEGLEPSARGFGVDVGTHQRERRRGGVARSPRSSPQRAVLIWCYEESEVEKACRAISFSSPTTISFCLYRATGVGNEITTC